jgi:hypothetical protein
MKSLPEVNALKLLLKKAGRSPAEVLFPDFSKYRYGYKLSFPLKFTVIYHPESVHYLLSRESRKLNKENRIVKNLEAAIGKGLATSSGEQWLEQKRKTHSIYPKTEREVISQSTIEIIDFYLEKLKFSTLANWLTLKIEILNCLIDINWNQIFNCRFPGNLNNLTKEIAEGNTLIALASAGNIPVLNKFIQLRLRKIYQAIVNVIKPFLSSGWNKGEIVNLLMTGSVTTAGNLLFCLLKLIEDEEYIDHFCKDNFYRRLFLMEGLRLNPSVWGLWYESNENIETTQFCIQKNELIVFNIHAMHRHPEYWTDANDFIPERFKNFSHENKSYLPFGHGPRKCIGQHLSLQILSITLEKLIKSFDFHLKPGMEIKSEFNSVIFPKLDNGDLKYVVKKNEDKTQLLNQQ